MAVTMQQHLKKNNKGFTIFFALLVGGLALSVGVAIYDLAVREIDLSSTATQSQYAIYAADTGAECALYWDFKCTSGYCDSGSAFATSSASVYPPDNSGLNCAGIDISGASNRTVVKPLGAGAATTTFTITFSPQPYCATVEVAKSGTPTKTTIISRGYNTCTASAGSAARLERALQVSY